MFYWGCGHFFVLLLKRARVIKFFISGMGREAQPKKVIVLYAKIKSLYKMFQSSTRHGKPGMNPEGPPSKAKYLLTTGSEQVA